jgi:hypothetical protein
VTDAQDGVLLAAADPEMAMIEQEVGSVLLERDRIRVFFADALHDFGVFHVHFEAARGALLGADLAAHHQAGLLGKSFQRVEGGFGQLRLHGHALHDAGAVANLGEADFAARPQVVQPPG